MVHSPLFSRALIAGSLVVSTAVALAMPTAAVADSAVVTLVAGGGVGDGGPALQAALNAIDAQPLPDGNLLIADAGHNSIRKLDVASGVITTVAGGQPGPDGLGGLAGDGGPATDATLKQPWHVEATPDGDYYIADLTNNVVRFVDHATGVISTVAGNGTAGTPHASADATTQPIGADDIAYDAATDSLYMADRRDGLLLRLNSDGSLSIVAGGGATYGDGGAPTDAKFFGLDAVALMPNGDVIVGSGGAGDVRRMHDGIITTIAGHGQTMAVDGASAYDSSLPQVDRLTVTADGTIITSSVASSTPLAFSPGGNLHAISAAPCSRIGGLTNSGRLLLTCASVWEEQEDGTFTRIAGTDLPPMNSIYAPADGTPATSGTYGPGIVGIAAIGTSTYVATGGIGVVDRIGPDGTVHRVAGTPGFGVGGPADGDGGPATAAHFQQTESVAPAPDGGFYVGDVSRLRKVAADGTITAYAGQDPQPFVEGQAASHFQFRRGVSVVAAPNGDLYMPDWGVNGNFDAIRVIRAADDTVHTITTSLHFIGGSTSTYYSEGISSIAVAPDGSIVVASNQDFYNGSHVGAFIRRINPATGDGTILYNGTKQVSSVAVTADNSVYFGTDNGYFQSSLIQRLGDDGSLATVAGGGHNVGDGASLSDAFFTQPKLALAADGSLLIADNPGSNGRIRKMPLAGVTLPPAATSPSLTSTLAGDGTATLNLSWQLPATMPEGAHVEVYLGQSRTATPVVNPAVSVKLPATATSTSFTSRVPGMRYVASVYVIGANGDRSAAASASVVAPGDTVGPQYLDAWQGLSTDSTLELTWDDTREADFAGVKVFLKPGSEPSTADADLVYDGSGFGTTITGLTVGQTYTLAMLPRDYSGNTGQVQQQPFIAGASPRAVPTTGPADGSVSGRDVDFAFAPDGLGVDGASAINACTVDGQSQDCPDGALHLRDLTGGSHTVTARPGNKLGSGVATSVTWSVDASLPQVTSTALPTTTLTGTGLFTFAAQDASGVSSYAVRQRTGDAKHALGTWTQPAAWQSLTAKQLRVPVSAGQTRCVSVRATDTWGNASPWSAPLCTSRPLDDTALTRSAHQWKTTSSSDFYSGSASESSTTGARLTLTGLRASTVSLVVTTCSTCGTIGVYSGSTLVKTISLHSTKTVRQRVIAVPRSAAWSGTMSIKVTKAGKVSIDGLVATAY